MAEVIAVKGLAHKAIIGLNLLQKYAAKVNILNKKLILYMNGSKSVHLLIEKEVELKSIQVVTAERLELALRAQTIIECSIGDIEDSTRVYFEASSEVATLPIAIAGTIDVGHNGCIVTQIVNPTIEKFTLRPGTVIGHVEVVPEKEEKLTRPESQHSNINTTEWLRQVHIGEGKYDRTDVKRITDLL